MNNGQNQQLSAYRIKYLTNTEPTKRREKFPRSWLHTFIFHSSLSIIKEYHFYEQVCLDKKLSSEKINSNKYKTMHKQKQLRINV